MRATLIILAIFQLLLRAVAVPHCHAHECLTSATDHAERPHIHLSGHSHSADRNADKHGHSHGHGHSNGHGHSHPHDSHSELPALTFPLPEHDQSAFYVGCEVLTAAVDRIELPAADSNSLLDSDLGRATDTVVPQSICYCETRPPEGSIFAPLVVLPHMLRL